MPTHERISESERAALIARGIDPDELLRVIRQASAALPAPYNRGIWEVVHHPDLAAAIMAAEAGKPE